MITVFPSDNKEEIQRIFSQHSLAADEYSGVVCARFNDEVLGCCLYSLYEKSICILDVEPKDDIMLADGILRSALHIAARRGIGDAYYSEKAPEEVFSKLGFIKDRSERKLDIDKLFSGCKCGM